MDEYNVSVTLAIVIGIVFVTGIVCIICDIFFPQQYTIPKKIQPIAKQKDYDVIIDDSLLDDIFS
jgi:hypothetical protein